MTWHAATVLFGRLALLGGLAAALFLLFLLPHRGWRWMRGPARWALRHPALAPAARRLPAVFGFAERHFGGDERSWLRLALGALFVGAGLRWFARVLAAVLTDGTVVVADRRLHNTVAAFHSPAMQRSLSLATDLASAAFIAPLDPHGPATPAYYQEEPQDLTFEKPGDASGSIRHRHHIRIWRTGLYAAPGAVPVWAATSSYDAGVKLVAKPYLVTHRIDPQIDRERELIAGDLLTAGARPLARVTVTGPTRGKNAGEDSFVTDGVARVLALP